MENSTGDCLVIGAGPAGLVAATYLSRFRRPPVVIDGNDSRAAWIPVSHNLPGFPDGLGGPALLERLRAQALRYGATIAPGRVERLERTGQVFIAHGAAGEAWRARAVLLATGAQDVVPDLPGVTEAVRRGLVRQCPICDAFEVTGQRVALIGYGRCRVREALLLRGYTSSLTVLTLGQDLHLEADDDAALQEAGIRILRQPVERLAMENNRIAAWHMRDGGVHQFDTLYSALGARMRSDLATALGAEADADGALIVDAHQRTSVPGLYAAGDVVQGLSQIAVATGQAAIAATDINRSLGFLKA